MDEAPGSRLILTVVIDGNRLVVAHMVHPDSHGGSRYWSGDHLTQAVAPVIDDVVRIARS